MNVAYENLAKSNSIFMSDYKKAFSDFVEKGWYVLGEQVKSFEEEFASFIGTKYCIGVASGLDALIISLECLKLPRGGGRSSSSKHIYSFNFSDSKSRSSSSSCRA